MVIQARPPSPWGRTWTVPLTRRTVPGSSSRFQPSRADPLRPQHLEVRQVARMEGRCYEGVVGGTGLGCLLDVKTFFFFNTGSYEKNTSTHYYCLLKKG